VVDQVRSVGDDAPAAVYVVVIVELPAVEVTVTVPGTEVPVATSSRRASQ
jgi:hypothetical protein